MIFPFQCNTVNEQQCNTVNEQVCETVQEQQCRTGNDYYLYYQSLVIINPSHSCTNALPLEQTVFDWRDKVVLKTVEKPDSQTPDRLEKCWWWLIFLISVQDTVNEQECNTVNEQQCNTVNEQVCNTVQEQQCSTVQEQECSTVNEQQVLYNMSKMETIQSECFLYRFDNHYLYSSATLWTRRNVRPSTWRSMRSSARLSTSKCVTQSTNRSDFLSLIDPIVSIKAIMHSLLYDFYTVISLSYKIRYFTLSSDKGNYN